MNGGLFRERMLIVSRSLLPPVVAIAAVLLAILICLQPALTEGADAASTPVLCAQRVLGAVTAIAPGVTMVVGLLVLGRDGDIGLAQETHLLGLRRGALARCDATIAALAGIACGAAMLVAAVMFGTADVLRRSLIGPSAPAAHAPTIGWMVWATPVIVVGAAGLALLLTAGAVWSARRSLALLFAMIGSGIILLAVSAGASWRPILLWHPLGGLWSLIYHGPSDRLRLTGPPPVVVGSILLWLAVLVLAAARHGIPALWARERFTRG